FCAAVRTRRTTSRAFSTASSRLISPDSRRSATLRRGALSAPPPRPLPPRRAAPGPPGPPPSRVAGRPRRFPTPGPPAGSPYCTSERRRRGGRLRLGRGLRRGGLGGLRARGGGLGGLGRRARPRGRARRGDRAGGRPRVDRRGSRGVRRRVHLRADAQLLLDTLLDLVGEVGVVAQERAGVLLALTELVALVGEPRPGLAHEAVLHAHVDEPALAGDADPVQDVELGLLERRGHLVLDDLDAGAVTHRVGALLEGLDAPDVEADRRVELQRLATGRGLGRTEEHTDLLAELVDEDRGGAGRAERTGDLAQGLRHEAGLQAHVAVTHLALDLGLGR